MKNTIKIFGIVFIAVTLLFNVITYFYLPSTMVVQMKLDGSAGTTLPKLVYLGGSFIVISFLSLLMISNKDDSKRITLITGLVFIVNIVGIIFNL